MPRSLLLSDDQLEAQLVQRMHDLYPQLSKNGRLTIDMSMSVRGMAAHMKEYHDESSNDIIKTCPDYEEFVKWILRVKGQ